MKELRVSVAAPKDRPLIDVWLIDGGRVEVLALQREGEMDSDLAPLFTSWQKPAAKITELDPVHLPHPELSRRWGSMLACWLEDWVDDLLESAAGSLVRITFRPLDRVAARVPFETLVSPRNPAKPIIEDARVSLLRLPQALDRRLPPPGRLSGQEPGRHVALALYAPAVDLDPGPFIDAVAGLAGWRGLRASLVAKQRSEFRQDRGALEGRLAQEHVDLLVCGGHGRRDDGWQVDDVGIAGSEVARALAARPAAAVLAMCQSATVRSDGHRSMVEELAQSGVGLAVGLQGGDSRELDVQRFITEITRGLAQPMVEAPDRMMEAWEEAIIAGRRAMTAESVLPVVIVHPDHLAGVAKPRVSAARRGVSDPPTAPEGFATARPFYVPGQICCWDEDGRTLRLPLPVDAGARVTVSVTARGRAGGALEQAWDLPAGWRIEIECDAPAEVAGWAKESAELSAAIRAVSVLLREPPPDAVRELLDEAVAGDWGAHDAAPRAIDVATGASVLRFGGWPALDVKSRTALALDEADLKPLAVTRQQSEELESSLGDATTLLGVVDRFRQQASGAVPPQLRKGTNRHSIFVPSHAVVHPGTRESGVVALTSAPARREGWAPDTLRVR